MGDTEISWTHRPGTRGRTWNPVQGCSRISEGCRSCYAERLAARFAESGWSQGLINLKTRKWNGVLRLASHKLADPLRWREPSTVFTNSMSDLFHENLSNEQIAAVFGVMAAAPQHTFQVLTKRVWRMREWFEWIASESATCNDGVGMQPAARCFIAAQRSDTFFDLHGRPTVMQSARAVEAALAATWPLPNVWLGVSVENQAAADERIPELLATPAAVRFLSCEPLIGPVHFGEQGPVIRWLRPDSLGVRWVIAGCESGPGARPCSVEWLRSLRDQCGAASVPFFLKQATADRDPLRSRCPECGERIRWYVHGPMHSSASCACTAEGAEDASWHPTIGLGDGSKRKAADVIELPYLDGVQHAAFPEGDDA